MQENTAPVEDRNKKIVNEAFEWMESLLFALAFVIIIFIFILRTVTVEGESMLPTLHSGDNLFVTTLGGSVKQGDVVAITKLTALNKPLVKRVIATGGQTIDILAQTGEVVVDGIVLEEPYIAEMIDPDRLDAEMQFPQTVPPGNLFVMGDNRNHSWDSRYAALGMIDERHVLGKAFFRYAPLDRLGLLDKGAGEDVQQ